VPKARELVATRLGEELTADDVAQALGVSYRVLHYAFRDALGVSPYRFLLTEKLHSARRQLKTANTSVTDALLAHGFSTPARFAQQYKRLFGELPSQTLAATRARPAA
jgi:AraC family ethanolamine operon transcriptional activator